MKRNQWASRLQPIIHRCTKKIFVVEDMPTRNPNLRSKTAIRSSDTISRMAKNNNIKIGFEKQIWDAACVLWGHIPAAEYRKVIVGLIFLRYISSAFEKRYEELVKEGEGFEDDRDAYTAENIFFVPEDARWSKISSAAHTPEIGTVIDDAMRAIEKENSTLKKRPHI